MVRFALAILAAFLMGSAHAVPSIELHEQLGLYTGQLRQCFDREMVSPKFYADTVHAMAMLSEANGYDRDIIKYASNAAYAQTVANTSLCRQVEATGYSFQTKLAQSEAKVLQDAANRQIRSQAPAVQAESYPQVQKPIWCNRVGSMTMCN